MESNYLTIEEIQFRLILNRYLSILPDKDFKPSNNLILVMMNIKHDSIFHSIVYDSLKNIIDAHHPPYFIHYHINRCNKLYYAYRNLCGYLLLNDIKNYKSIWNISANIINNILQTSEDIKVPFYKKENNKICSYFINISDNQNKIIDLELNKINIFQGTYISNLTGEKINENHINISIFEPLHKALIDGITINQFKEIYPNIYGKICNLKKKMITIHGNKNSCSILPEEKILFLSKLLINLQNNININPNLQKHKYVIFGIKNKAAHIDNLDTNILSYRCYCPCVKNIIVLDSTTNEKIKKLCLCDKYFNFADSISFKNLIDIFKPRIDDNINDNIYQNDIINNIILLINQKLNKKIEIINL